MALNKDEYESVFGNTKTDIVISESTQGSGNPSSASSKRADAEAELAVKVEQAKAMQTIQSQQARLDKLESEWKVKETQMLAEIKQKEVEIKLKLDEEKIRLQQLQADNEVKVAAARLRAYNHFEGFEGFEEETDHKTQYSGKNAGFKTPLNPQATLFQPHPAHSEAPVAQEVSLAQAIASALTLNRLPVPEPTTFIGDPLKFIDWKISFMALIDQKKCCI